MIKLGAAWELLLEKEAASKKEYVRAGATGAMIGASHQLVTRAGDARGLKKVLEATKPQGKFSGSMARVSRSGKVGRTLLRAKGSGGRYSSAVARALGKSALRGAAVGGATGLGLMAASSAYGKHRRGAK